MAELDHIKMTVNVQGKSVVFDINGSIHTIQADKHGLIVTVSVVRPDGTPGQTQLGFECINKYSAHISAL